MAWNDLNMLLRRYIIREAVKAGLTNPEEIASLYDYSLTTTPLSTHIYDDGGFTIEEYDPTLGEKIYRSFLNESGQNVPLVDAAYWYLRLHYPYKESDDYTEDQYREDVKLWIGKNATALSAMYGKKWQQLDDYEKMAILDKAYDNMASVSKGSPFYKAVMSDDPNIGKYLDSQWLKNMFSPAYGEMLKIGNNTYTLPSASIYASRPTPPPAKSKPINLKLYQDVNSIEFPDLTPLKRKLIEELDKVNYTPVFDRSLADFTDPYFNLMDKNQYKTFKYALALDKVNAENKHKAWLDLKTLLFLYNMLGLADTDRLRSLLEALKYQYDYYNSPFSGPIVTMANGGSIHIKPENRGKFNATKRRTGKTTEELTHSKNPLTRKRAIFALNARKWKHAMGGNLYPDGGELTDEEYYDIMEKVANENYEKWGYKSPDAAMAGALNDNTYDYRGYYNKYPDSAANADTHWPDEFKTVYHPTFSNQSRYSGVVDERYNPLGLVGGYWSWRTQPQDNYVEEPEEIFIPALWQRLGLYKNGGNLFKNGGNPDEPPLYTYNRNTGNWDLNDKANYEYAFNKDGNWYWKDIFGNIVDYSGKIVDLAKIADTMTGGALSETYPLYFEPERVNYRNGFTWNGIPYIMDNENPLYIGGDKWETRKKYWLNDPVMSHAADSIANKYGISSNLLKFRLGQEGMVDLGINYNNDNILYGDAPLRGYKFLNSDAWKNNEEMGGFTAFGLDDVGDMIELGKVKPINETWGSGEATNEHDRIVHTAEGHTVKDNMGLMAGTLRYYKDLYKKNNPDASDEEAEEYANAAYNKGKHGADVYFRNNYWNQPGVKFNKNKDNLFNEGGNIFEDGGSTDDDFDEESFMNHDYQVPDIIITPQKHEKMPLLTKVWNKAFRSKEGFNRFEDRWNENHLIQPADNIQIGYNPELQQQAAHTPKRDGTPTQREAYFDEFRKNSEQGLYTLTDEEGNITGTTPSYTEYLYSKDRPLSGTDPIAEFYVAGNALGPLFNAAGRGIQWMLGKNGNQWVRNKIINKAFNNLTKNLESKTNIYPNASYHSNYLKYRDPESGFIERAYNGDDYTIAKAAKDLEGKYTHLSRNYRKPYDNNSKVWITKDRVWPEYLVKSVEDNPSLTIFSAEDYNSMFGEPPLVDATGKIISPRITDGSFNSGSVWKGFPLSTVDVQQFNENILKIPFTRVSVNPYTNFWQYEYYDPTLKKFGGSTNTKN